MSLLLSILIWIIFGGISGLIASSLAGEGARINGWMNVGLGIIGAILGGVIFNLFGEPGVTGFNLYSFLVAIIGAILVLVIARLFSR